MKKQIKVVTLAAATVLGAAAMAYAAPAQLNIYGASAQGDFWIAEAYPFLTSLGCKAADGTTLLPTGNAPNANIAVNAAGDKVKYMYAAGYNCTNTNVPQDAADTHTPKWRNLEIREAGIASLEGAMSISRLAPLADGQLGGSNGTVTNPNNCDQSLGQRLMAKNGTIASYATDLGCYQVNVGTTDLEVANINQSAVDADYNPYPMPDSLPTMAGLTDTKALVVPFSFAVNKAVTARHCYDGTTKMSEFFCTSNTQCGTTASGANRTCSTTYETIDNLSRLQAVALFSGQINYWTDFNQGFVANAPVTVCVRQPGSGTHAALEKMVMTAGDSKNPSSNIWGKGINGVQNLDPSAPPVIDYIKSSDNMVDCINNSAGLPNREWAVGYVDADKNATTYAYAGITCATNDNVLATKPMSSCTPNAYKVNYQGVFPSRANVRNGKYDFYSVGHMFTRSDIGTVFPLLATFAKNPLNIPGTVAATFPNITCNPNQSKCTWWATLDEMRFVRNTDLDYPVKVSPTVPVTP